MSGRRRYSGVTRPALADRVLAGDAAIRDPVARVRGLDQQRRHGPRALEPPESAARQHHGGGATCRGDGDCNPGNNGEPNSTLPAVNTAPNGSCLAFAPPLDDQAQHHRRQQHEPRHPELGTRRWRGERPSAPGEHHGEA